VVDTANLHPSSIAKKFKKGEKRTNSETLSMLVSVTSIYRNYNLRVESKGGGVTCANAVLKKEVFRLNMKQARRKKTDHALDLVRPIATEYRR